MAAKSGGDPRVRRVSRRSQRVAVFTRQMATLLRAEVPLLRGLETILRQTPKGPYRLVIEDLAEQVRGGNRFSQALARYPAIFDGMLLNMVKAGEASGRLAEVLDRVAEHREKSRRLSRKVFTALIYPLVVLLVAVIIVAFLMVFVIPQFQNIYATTMRGQSLPWLTQWLIDLSAFVQEEWSWLLLGAGALVLAVRAFLGSAVGGAWRDQVLFAVPFLRGLLQRIGVARFTRTLGSLVESGVPILEALLIGRNVVGNVVLRRALDQVRAEVKDGDPLARALERTGVFPALVPSMIAVGEETGRLGELCGLVADTYDEEVDSIVSGLTALIEPIMIVLLAVIVGAIVIALFLPIASIFQQGGF
jgi:type IV pilus assembly protein PilC